MRKKRERRGFTLIELMVVILIVGILAAVAIPVLRGRIDAAKWSEGRAMMGSIATSIRAWCAEKGPDYDSLPLPTYPTTLAHLGFGAGDCTGTYFADADFTFAVTACGPPPQFTVTCAAGSQAGAPTTPAGGYVLTGNADGTTTWSP